jgi:type VI secretion system protein ImpA
MESEPVLNFEELLAPIEGDSPSGIELRRDPDRSNPYWQLKDTRKQISQAERNQEDASGFWGVILKGAPSIIASKSKDLEVVAWLVEALVRKHGFAGLRDGLRLTRRLLEEFWEHLYPSYDEDDGFMDRGVAFSSLSGGSREGTLIRPIRSIPFTTSPDFSHTDILLAKQLDATEDQDRRAQMIENGAPQLADIQSAVDSTSPDHLQAVVADLKASKDELSQVSSLFVKNCGNTPSGDPAYPSLTNIRQVIEEYEDSLRTWVGDLENRSDESADTGGEEESTQTQAPAAAAMRSTGNSGAMNRDEAFRQLNAIATFFRQTEPHSPISYGLEQIVRWGRMSLPDLWKELIRDEMGRVEAFRLVGIKTEEDEES